MSADAASSWPASKRINARLNLGIHLLRAAITALTSDCSAAA
jgi:hypothetical protein